MRFIPLAGVLFVVLFVAGIFLGTGPDTDDDDATVLAWYGDSGHQTTSLMGAYGFALAGVSMLLFGNRLRLIVEEAEPGKPVYAPFIQGGVTVFVACLAVGAATFAAVPAGIKLGGEDLPANADLVRFLPQIGWGAILVLGMFPLIFAMLTTAYASMRFGIFPAWFTWLTVVCGVLLIFAAMFLPVLALGIWMIAGTVVLMKKQPASMVTAPA